MELDKIGFYTLIENDKKSFLGAILVTTNVGIPLEFKCTHPISPTELQRTLYGNSLKSYIGLQLCGEPLIKSLSNTPDLIYVNSKLLLELEKFTEIGIVAISKQGKLNPASEILETQIISSEKTYDPIIFNTYQPNKEKIKDLKLKTSNLFNSFDLIEAFDRIDKSISILALNDEKFK